MKRFNSVLAQASPPGGGKGVSALHWDGRGDARSERVTSAFRAGVQVTATDAFDTERFGGSVGLDNKPDPRPMNPLDTAIASEALARLKPGDLEFWFVVIKPRILLGSTSLLWYVEGDST